MTGGVGRSAIALAFGAGLVGTVACHGGEAAGRAGADARLPADSLGALAVVGAPVRRGDLVLTIRTTVAVRPGARVAAGALLVQLDRRPLDLAVREAQAALADAEVRYEDLLIGVAASDSSDPARRRRETSRLRAGVDGAEARLERARLDAARATVRAPFAGTVDRVAVVAGQGVSAGDAAATLVDLGSLIVEAAVLEHDLPLIRVGASAVVTKAAGGPGARARVAAVLPLVDTTSHAGGVLVALRAADGDLRPGMYADVELEATRLSSRVLVPAAAVIERDGRPLVFRARSDCPACLQTKPVWDSVARAAPASVTVLAIAGISGEGRSSRRNESVCSARSAEVVRESSFRLALRRPVATTAGTSVTRCDLGPLPRFVPRSCVLYSCDRRAAGRLLRVLQGVGALPVSRSRE
jgi:RND family efflux transporter MFP subunit